MTKKADYQFNSEIQSKLKAFASYLHEQGNAPGTIRQKSNYAGHFLTWLQTQCLEPQQTRYNDLLHFIDHCKLDADSTRHINNPSKEHTPLLRLPENPKPPHHQPGQWPAPERNTQHDNKRNNRLCPAGNTVPRLPRP